jgi:ABC-type glycerol-3-phosphate transport system permease component
MPTTRGWLKLHGYLVMVCAVMSLVIGLDLWFDTLKTRSNLSSVWALQTPAVQSLLQQKLQCCGYLSSSSPPFVTDGVCTNALVAAQLGGCVGKFSSFANNFLDLVFTAVFGAVGMYFRSLPAFALSRLWISRREWLLTFISLRHRCGFDSLRCDAAEGQEGEGEISTH